MDRIEVVDFQQTLEVAGGIKVWTLVTSLAWALEMCLP